MKPILNSAYICVRNMDRAIDFYEKFLEQKVEIRDTTYSRFNINGFRLGLFNPSTVNEKVAYGDNCLLSFQVDNIDTVLTKLKNLNSEIVYPLTKIGGNMVLEFRDPEGNDIEVYCPISSKAIAPQSQNRARRE
jgi:predicted enzyme related to lactoylglutathione lyase